MGFTSTIVAGEQAERLAQTYLSAEGLSLLTRNFRARGGEIDLIMLDGATLVFVEVRFRRSNTFGKASHTVDIHKQRKIIHTAAMYTARNRAHALRTMRFDVVALEGNGIDGLEWIKDAFRPNNSTL